jgi:hypothetical protein
MIFRVAFKGSTWRELDADLFTISRGLLAFAALIAACAGRLYLDFRCWSLLRHARVPMASSGIASWQTRSVVTKCRRAEAARKTRANASIFNLGVLAGECGTMVPIWQRICGGTARKLRARMPVVTFSEACAILDLGNKKRPAPTRLSSGEQRTGEEV